MATVKQWPTPAAHDSKDLGVPPSQTERNSLMLPVAASRHSGRPDETTTPDGPPTSPKADLNPRFVESLMGLPSGWLTPSTSVATDSYRSWLHTHSPNWQLVLVSESGCPDD